MTQAPPISAFCYYCCNNLLFFSVIVSVCLHRSSHPKRSSKHTHWWTGAGVWFAGQLANGSDPPVKQLCWLYSYRTTCTYEQDCPPGAHFDYDTTVMLIKGTHFQTSLMYVFILYKSWRCIKIRPMASNNNTKAPELLHCMLGTCDVTHRGVRGRTSVRVCSVWQETECMMEVRTLLLAFLLGLLGK